MALSINSVWEVRAAGSDTNGGGFVTGSTGADYSQQNSAQVALTNAVAVGTTTITDVSAPFTAAMVGNGVYLQGGTGSLAAGWYQILTFVNSTTITLDRNVATGTGITMNIGGALASIGNTIAAGAVGGHIIYVQSGTFTTTTATTNVSGGAVNTTAELVYAGYSTNRTLTNTDTKPIIKYGVASFGMFATRGTIYNLAFDGNGQTGAQSTVNNDTGVYVNCSFTNMRTLGFGEYFIGCTATANSVPIFNIHSIDCEAYANTATPFWPSAESIFTRCLSYNNTGTTTDGFLLSAPSVAVNCISYGNGRSGFNWNSAGRTASCINCHAENNAAWGFDNASATSAGVAQIITNCSAYNNAGGAVSNTSKALISNFITVTAGSVFVNAASGNFALNNTASQGALLRAAGAPALFPAGLTASYQDIGAAQHQDSGGSSVTIATAIAG